MFLCFQRLSLSQNLFPKGEGNPFYMVPSTLHGNVSYVEVPNSFSDHHVVSGIFKVQVSVKKDPRRKLAVSKRFHMECNIEFCQEAFQ